MWDPISPWVLETVSRILFIGAQGAVDDSVAEYAAPWVEVEEGQYLCLDKADAWHAFEAHAAAAGADATPFAGEP